MNSNTFISNAKAFIRNPLGVIGLFVSLIYGFACLILGFGIKNFNAPEERLPLIWFIVAFPILILIAFLWLVIKHHTKLYGPADFQNDTTFALMGNPELLIEIEKVKDKVEKALKDSSVENNAPKKAETEILQVILEDLEKLKNQSYQIPINTSWEINHWKSNTAKIEKRR